MLRYGKRILKSAGRAIINHPRTIVGSAAIAGAIAAKPLGPAYEEIVNKELLGREHATKQMFRSSAIAAMQDSFMTPSQRRFHYGGYSRRPGYGPGNTFYNYPGGFNPSFPIKGNLTGPSGDLVFGLYNLRI